MSRLTGSFCIWHICKNESVLAQVRLRKRAKGSQMAFNQRSWMMGSGFWVYIWKGVEKKKPVANGNLWLTHQRSKGTALRTTQTSPPEAIILCGLPPLILRWNAVRGGRKGLKSMCRCLETRPMWLPLPNSCPANFRPPSWEPLYKCVFTLLTWSYPWVEASCNVTLCDGWKANEHTFGANWCEPYLSRLLILFSFSFSNEVKWTFSVSVGSLPICFSQIIVYQTEPLP